MTTEGNEVFLQIAVDTAREAGALLLADFLKPGGPSGHGSSHATADDEAEALIRRRLLGATPGYGFLGEETGFTAPTAKPAMVWVVDPNDGTASFLKGARGSAVSIALLRDRMLVLGVVFAFAAPDNDGDLFAWAEGCGPLRRNGVAVSRVPWTTNIELETVVLVSPSAGDDLEACRTLSAPGRYRVEPSIAYRLALVAAGEGDVAVSTNGPGDWDYAAGHALIIGAGGTFVNESSLPITYSPHGHSSTSRCAGGAPALVGEIAQRLKPIRHGKSSASADPYTLCRPAPGMTITDNGLLKRAQGCLLGQLAGDALGSMVEFKSATEIAKKYPNGLRKIDPSKVWGTLAGQPTDDSELALMLARTLANGEPFADEQIARAYQWWYQSHPFDIGTTTRNGMGGMKSAERADTSLAAGARDAACRMSQHSQSNGALMRQSPLAIWGHALTPERLDAYVRLDTTLTHPNRVCQDASAAFIVAVAAVIREGLDAETAYEQACAWHRAHGESDEVTKALKDARDHPPEFGPHIGHVLIALQNAFYRALHAPSFEAGVIDTVMAGGDTDTNGAIAGALLGAIHGAPAVSLQWQQALLTCRPDKDDPSVHQPRPQAFWPVDVFCLAERLVVHGAEQTAEL